MTIFELAGTAYGSFERVTRDNGDEFIRTKDDAPEWVTELVREAHGEMFPDDLRYELIRSALGWIHDNEPDDLDDAHEFADSSVDAYTLARFHWLTSDLRRQFYVDDACEEFGFSFSDSQGIASAIGLGQYAEAAEVYGYVVHALREQANDDQS